MTSMRDRPWPRAERAPSQGVACGEGGNALEGFARVGRGALLVAIGLWVAACGAAPSGGEDLRVEPPRALDEDEGESAPEPDPWVAGVRMLPTRTPPAERLGTLPAAHGRAPGTVLDVFPNETGRGGNRAVRDLLVWAPLLIVFHQGEWCPYGAHQLQALAGAIEALEARGVRPVAVSADGIETTSAWLATSALPFAAMADPDLFMHRVFDVDRALPAEELARLEGLGIDVEAASGRDHRRVAVPSVFLVNARGVVLWSHADTDVRTRPSIEQLLAVIDQQTADDLFPPPPPSLDCVDDEGAPMLCPEALDEEPDSAEGDGMR